MIQFKNVAIAISFTFFSATQTCSHENLIFFIIPVVQSSTPADELFAAINTRNTTTVLYCTSETMLVVVDVLSHILDS
jgi:hypothetical protein